MKSDIKQSALIWWSNLSSEDKQRFTNSMFNFLEYKRKGDRNVHSRSNRSYKSLTHSEIISIFRVHGTNII